MRMLLTAALIAVSAAPANAGWQYTEWGMTWDEVRAAMPFEFDPSKEVQHEAAGITFRVGFKLFEKGLEKVSLYPVTYSDCQALLKNLEAAYGASEPKGNSVFTWASDPAGNAVTLSMAKNDTVCVVEYAPAYSPNTDGL